MDILIRAELVQLIVEQNIKINIYIHVLQVVLGQMDFYILMLLMVML